jgi:hypothetical protein
VHAATHCSGRLASAAASAAVLMSEAKSAAQMENEFNDVQHTIEEALERQRERALRTEERAATVALQQERAREAEMLALKGTLALSQARGRAENGEEVTQQENVEERDEKPVVDWLSDPDPEIARVSRLYRRPTFIIQKEQPPIAFWFDLEEGPETGLVVLAGGEIASVVPGCEADRRGVTIEHTLVKIGNTSVTPAETEADIRDMLSERPIEVRFKGGATDKRLIFDKADAVLDEKGWQTALSKSGQTPQEYPCASLDIDEMGTIGGVGLRLYFFLLKFLTTCFFVMAVITTPSIVIIYSEFEMYGHTEAARYRTQLSQTTLGNVKMAVDSMRESDTVCGRSR